jgi:rSAM-associated Gly-rich repeat protein
LKEKTMKITTPISLFGFLLALSALNAQAADAAKQSSAIPQATDTAQTIDSRLSKLSAAIRQRENLVPTGDADNFTTPAGILLAGVAWGNGGGGAAFRNAGGGGAFRNGGGGWGNGFRNGGGFVNVRR